MTVPVDPLFPLPEPQFIFVHIVTRYRTSQVQREHDSEGWRESIDLTTTPHDDTMAYVASPNVRDVGAYELVDSVILLPRDFPVSKGDTIEAKAQDGLYDIFVGLWEIGQIRPNPALNRLLCSKSSIDAQVDV